MTHIDPAERKVQFGISLPPDDYIAIKREAAARDDTVSALIQFIVRRWVATIPKNQDDHA